MPTKKKNLRPSSKPLVRRTRATSTTTSASRSTFGRRARMVRSSSFARDLMQSWVEVLAHEYGIKRLPVEQVRLTRKKLG